MRIKKLLKRIHCILHDDRTVLHKDESIENWEEVKRERLQADCEKQKRSKRSLPHGFCVRNISMQVGSNVLFGGSNSPFSIRTEKAIYLKFQSISVWRSPVVSFRILSLTMSRSRDRRSLPSGKQSKKLSKRKRARSPDLAPKQHNMRI